MYYVDEWVDTEGLLFRDAEPGQLAYIRRYYMEQWKKQQEKEIEHLFDCYNRYTCLFDELPPLTPWMRWCKDYICRSFENLDRRWTWVEALAMQEDDSVFMTAHGEQAFKHLRLIRNYARSAYKREDHGIDIDFQKKRIRT